MPLFGDDVAVQQFIVKNGKAELVRNGDKLAVKLGSRDATLEIKMLVKIAGDVTKRQLIFGIPPALSSQIVLALGESEADVDSSDRRFRLSVFLEKDKTRVEAVMGSAS